METGARGDEPMSAEDDRALAQLDKDFDLLKTGPRSEAAYEMLKKRDSEWKEQDPEGYKKDMENMCREMCGDKWEAEYVALLREEFPEEFA
jgi:hypothetical protein